jgi:hypothetical protein
MTTELSTMDYYTDGSNQSYRTSGSTLVIPDTILEVVYDYLNENYSCK